MYSDITLDVLKLTVYMYSDITLDVLKLTVYMYSDITLDVLKWTVYMYSDSLVLKKKFHQLYVYLYAFYQLKNKLKMLLQLCFVIVCQ